MHAMVVHRLGLSWPDSVRDAGVSIAFTAVAAFVTTIQYRYYQPGSGNQLFRLLFAVMVTTLTCAAIRYALAFTSSGASFDLFLDASMPVRFVVTLLLIAFVTIVNWVIGYSRDHRRDLKRRADAEREKKDAELTMLRQQIQPHFLFNSLNSVSALIPADPAMAGTMIHKLSAFFRGTLQSKNEALVSLSEELAHVQLYLDIEKVRFGDRLCTAINSAPEVKDRLVPHLILQPVIENAVKFGVYGTTGPVTISLVTIDESGTLTIIVRNPFDKDHVSKGTGFGLRAVAKRLQLIYGRNDLLSASAMNNIFTVTITIPPTASV
jgi:two-component system, LytTR family, sensor kinase